jgi:hypothetical protein
VHQNIKNLDTVQFYTIFHLVMYIFVQNINFFSKIFVVIYPSSRQYKPNKEHKKKNINNKKTYGGR